MRNDNYRLFTKRSIKSQFTKLKNRLFNPSHPNLVSTESECVAG